MPSGEYLIEWIHRLAATITGALVIATTVASYLNSRADAKIKVTRSLAAAFVITDHAWRARNRPETARGSGCNLFGIGILLFAMVLMTMLFAFWISREQIVSRA